ncbi:ABC transporter transmembrane domain-containing protein [Kitasatospora sp. NPDC057015]|uniref:ABC transporter transmembrane domain-containing protein n=1 Tax=Kitasatospora sp. NPDC057015 TaxID=3346001 RepID=UPI00364550CC
MSGQNSVEYHRPNLLLRTLGKRFRVPVTFGVVAGIAGMLARSFIPVVIGLAVDRGLVAHDRPALLRWAGLLVALVLAQSIAGLAQERCDFRSMTGPSYHLVHLINAQAARLGSGLRARTTSGEVVSIGVGDIEPLGAALAAGSRGVGAVVAIGVVATIVLSSSWQLGLIVLVGVGVNFWLLALLLGPLRRRQQDLRRQQGELMGMAVDIAGGLRVLHGFGGEQRLAERYRLESQLTRRLATRTARVEAALSGVKVLVPGLLATAIVWRGADLVLASELSVGRLIAFYGYAVFLVTPLRWLTETAELLTRAQVSAARVSRFLALEPHLADQGAADLPPGPAELVDPESGLKIRHGEFTAIACSSTGEAAELADRLGRYTDSAVTWGDVPLTELPLAAVRERILVVHNDDHLFAGRLGLELDPLDRAGAGALAAHARTASATDVIDRLPQGLDSEVQPGARDLSGGERQRLRLLRALAVAPEVLVLVEPTGALDAHTETRVAQRLRAGRARRTTVVFTTSATVLGEADTVLYVRDLSVVGEGPHSALLADADYHALVTRGSDPR